MKIENYKSQIKQIFICVITFGCFCLKIFITWALILNIVYLKCQSGNVLRQSL